jgi:hypothetical protein
MSDGLQDGKTYEEKQGTNHTRYVSYLIRIWQPQGRVPGTWLASAEASGSHERHSFADLSGLYAFLEAQTLRGDLEQDETH